MRSQPRPGPARLLILLSTLSVAGGCAHTPPPTPIQPAFNCSSLVPAHLAQPVASTPVPAPDVTASGLWSSLDDQTARLDQANTHGADALEIVQRCEAAKTAAVAAQRPKTHWWWPF